MAWRRVGAKPVSKTNDDLVILRHVETKIQSNFRQNLKVPSVFFRQDRVGLERLTLQGR